MTVMNLADALGWAGLPIIVAGVALWLTDAKGPSFGWAVAAVGAFAEFAATALTGLWFFAAYFGLVTALFIYLWWKNRPKGKWRKAARELGAKSRARVEALARQMTPSPIPTLAGGA